MLEELPNVTKADLSGLNTSNVIHTSLRFNEYLELAQIKAGANTFAKGILTNINLPNKALFPKSGGDPILPTDLPSVINASNTGWYNVVDAD